MTVDIELLKLIGAAFALIVSTATVQFKIADFINAKRDAFPGRPKGPLSTFGEVYDWAWGYLIGILVNLVFLVVAIALRDATKSSDFAAIGGLLFWLYLVNLVGWIGGMIIDGFRLKLSCQEPPAQSTDQAA